jgi:hypothetical protein
MQTIEQPLKTKARLGHSGGRISSICLTIFGQSQAASQTKEILSPSGHNHGQHKIRFLKKGIHSYFLSPENKKCSLQFYLEQDISHIFSLPLSQQAADQILHLENHIQSLNIDEFQNDIWTYCWGSMNYSSKKAYTKLQGYSEASPLFSWLWGSNNLGKHKFFFWLLLRDRLSTRNLLRRKNMFLEDYSCVLCNSGQEETFFHLFFECPFSTSCWHFISIHWNLNLQPLDMIISAREDFGSNIFREIIITACWAIWLVRNGVIFDNEQASVNEWRRRFKKEIGFVCTKAKPARQAALNLWRDTHL